MQDYEKLGVFYLGREYDLAAQKLPRTWCCMIPRTWSRTPCASA